VIEHVLVPETVWSLCLSEVQQKLSSSFWDSKVINRVHVVSHGNALINSVRARCKEQCIFVVDLNQILTIRFKQNSKWTILDDDLK